MFIFVGLKTKEERNNSKKLHELSKEYMLDSVKQKIFQELIHESRAFVNEETDKDLTQYEIPILILADEMRCEEAVEICSRFISKNVEIFCGSCGLSKTWTLIMENENMRVSSKTKFLGMVMEKISVSYTHLTLPTIYSV